MNDLSLWNLMREAWTALSDHFEPVIEKLVTDSGLEARTWGLLLASLTFEPDNTTPAHLMVRVPYTSAETYLKRLEKAADMGYLTEVANGEFYLTPVGRAETQRFIEQARLAMKAADPLPLTDSRRLAALLDHLVHSCLNTSTPPDVWSIRLSHRLMPAYDPPMPFIEQAFSCLSAYRDDAHLAAWQASGLTATALESLTYLWRSQANSLDGLVELLASRGHPRPVYVAAVADLRRRKYVASIKGKLRITAEGKRFREQVEVDTDRYFYRPWTALSAAEKAEMEKLLLRLGDGLKKHR